MLIFSIHRSKGMVLAKRTMVKEEKCTWFRCKGRFKLIKYRNYKIKDKGKQYETERFFILEQCQNCGRHRMRTSTQGLITWVDK